MSPDILVQFATKAQRQQGTRSAFYSFAPFCLRGKQQLRVKYHLLFSAVIAIIG
jgi:hypothetical protein